MARLTNFAVASLESFRAIETAYGRLTILADDGGAVSPTLRQFSGAENHLDFLNAIVDADETVVDVGAGVGAHALAFSHFVGSGGLVVAVEPQARFFALLERNIEANGLTNVRAENASVANGPRDAVYPRVDGEPSGGAAGATAQTTSVDALGLADCALIRIDLADEEELVLRGARETLRRNAPIVYAECESLDRGLKVLASLKDCGYRVLAHVVSLPDSAPFERNDEIASGAARAIALVGVAGARVERIERYQVRPGEILIDIVSADDLAVALHRQRPVAARRLGKTSAIQGDTDGAAIDWANNKELREKLDQRERALADVQRLALERASETKDLRDKLDRVQAALADIQRLAVERGDENRELHGRLDRVHAALADTQQLAVERAKQIEALNKRIDYDEAVSIERQAILESLHLETEMYAPIPEALEGIHRGDQSSATLDDVVQSFRRILRRDIENEAEARAQFADGPTMRDLVRKLVHSVEGQTASSVGPLAKHAFDQREYLARNLIPETRYKCFVHHYDFLTGAVSNSALKLLVRNGVTLYASRPAQVEYSILMHNPRRGAYEGELSLFFVASGEAIFVLSFTVVPGYAVGLEDENVILIGRMQGQTRSPTAIREAAKDNSDVAPQAILFAALQGIARAIGIEHIAGVQATNLVAYEEEKAQALENAYDNFYASVGASGPHNGFYVWSASTPEKPLNQVKPGHRLRTKAKRAFKATIADRACLAWPLLFDPSYEFMALNARKTEVAILRSRITALRAELNRFAGPAAETIFVSVDNVLARLVSRATRSVGLRRLLMTRKTFERRVVKRGMFDESWYRTNYPDVVAAGLDPLEHYLAYGAAEGRDPNAFFSTRHYLSENPDVAQSGINPLVHYCLYGAAEKRASAHRLRPVGQLKPLGAAPAPPQAEKPVSELD